MTLGLDVRDIPNPVIADSNDAPGVGAVWPHANLNLTARASERMLVAIRYQFRDDEAQRRRRGQVQADWLGTAGQFDRRGGEGLKCRQVSAEQSDIGREIERSAHADPKQLVIDLGQAHHPADNAAETPLPRFIGRLPELFTQHAIDELEIIAHAVLQFLREDVPLLQQPVFLGNQRLHTQQRFAQQPASRAGGDRFCRDICKAGIAPQRRDAGWSADPPLSLGSILQRTDCNRTYVRVE